MNPISAFTWTALAICLIASSVLTSPVEESKSSVVKSSGASQTIANPISPVVAEGSDKDEIAGTNAEVDGEVGEVEAVDSDDDDDDDDTISLESDGDEYSDEYSGEYDVESEENRKREKSRT